MKGNPPIGSSGRPFISVIVLNWNGRHLLAECLQSVLLQQDGSIEIIVVDNGSTDGSVDFIRKVYGDLLRMLELDSNMGWAGGNNRGIEMAIGEYLLLLNNDACLEAGFIESLRKGIKRHSGAGMFTPKILDYYDRTLLDNAGHVIYGDGTARGRGRLRKDGEEFGREEEVLCPSGAAGVYHRDVFVEVGPIDERYFAYGEDTELGLRARRAGFTCYYLPDAVVYHKYSASGGAYTPRKVYWVERNRIWTVVKTFPWYLALLSPFRTFFRYTVGLYGLVSGGGAVGRLAERHSVGELLSAIVNAWLDGIRGVPEMWRKRRSLRRGQRVGDREFSGMLRRFRAGVREVAYKE
ncbi:MAG: glycosyltransferase family 2 protein [Deltaproteobacteria bacterium]|nr:glycosyltransferase family 2 protein [Candidatus Deferrimicrobium borealis]